MARTLDQETSRAKALFYLRDFNGAYTAFKRLYDRLPFEVNADHAECIAYFSRTLLELGKEFELKFYLKTLEDLYEKQQSIELAYQLAAIRATGPEWALNFRTAQQLLESIIRMTTDKRYLARSKMLLAYVFDCETEDIASCRKLIFSIEKVGDEEIDTFVEIWKAKILRDEKKYEAAELELTRLLRSIRFEDNWYAFVSIRILMAILFIRTERIDEAIEIQRSLIEVTQGRKMCVTQRALAALDSEIKKKADHETVTVSMLDDHWEVGFGRQKHLLKKGNAAERLLLQILKSRFLEKAAIIKLLFNREYSSVSDDKAVYYHIHSLRKYVTSLGLSPDSIVLEKDGYRFLPEVKFVDA